MRLLLFMLLLLVLVPSVYAPNDPGHDSLYIEETGDSELTGNLNISDELRIANLLYSAQLDVQGNGSQPSGSNAQIYTRASGNDLVLNAPTSLVLLRDSGSIVHVGTSGVDLNVSSNATVQYNLDVVSGSLLTAGTVRLSNAGVGTFAAGSTVDGSSICTASNGLCDGGGGGASGWNDTGGVVALLDQTDNVTAGNLTVDNTNGRVGVGTGTPERALDLDDGSIEMESGSGIYFERSIGSDEYYYINGTDELRIHTGSWTGGDLTISGNGQTNFDMNVFAGTTANGIDFTGLSSAGSDFLFNTSDGFIFDAGYGSGTATYDLMTQGAAALYIDSSGSVGLGTKSPGVKLDVDGSINVTSGEDICITGGNCLSTSGGSVGGSGAANGIAYWSDSSTLTSRADFLFNPTNGRTSLNTTTASATLNIGGDRVLGFYGGNSLVSAYDSGAWMTIAAGTNGNYNGNILLNAAEIRVNSYGGSATLNVKSFNDTDRIGVTIAASEGQTTDLLRFVNDSGSVLSAVDNIGQFGIGTSNPAATLHANGTIRFDDFTSCTALETDGSGNLVCGSDESGDSSDSGWNDTGGVVTLLDQTDNVTAGNLTVDNTNGRVGIGTTDPSASLEVVSGQILAPVGSVSNPGYAFSGDADTGIYRRTAGELNFAIDGSWIANIQSNGLVIYAGTGIFNRPGTAAAPSYAFGDDLNDDTGLFRPEENSIGFTTNGTEAMRINHSNVGIGTESPEEILHIDSNTDALLYVDAGPSGGSAHSGTRLLIEDNTVPYLEFLTPNTISAGILFSDEDANDVASVTYDHEGDALGVKSAGNFSVRTAGSDRLVIDNIGDLHYDTDTLFVDVSADFVGINTSSPSATLDVVGSIQFDDFTSCTALETDGSGNLVCGSDDTGSGSLWTNSSGNATYTDGRVGIGTTSPEAALHIEETTEQLRLGYNSGNYTSFTTGSDGSLTIGATATTGDADVTVDPQQFLNLGTGQTDLIYLGRTDLNIPTEIRGSFSVTNASGTQGLYQDTDGEVGIGTTSPSAALHIRTETNEGAARFDTSGGNVISFSTNSADHTYVTISTNNSGRNAGVSFTNVADGWGPWSIGRGTAGVFGISQTSVGSGGSFLNNAPFKIENGTPAETLYINSDGQVGINTGSPAYLLDVVGEGTSSEIVARFSNGTTGGIYVIPDLGSGGYSSISQAGDSGIIPVGATQNASALVLAPWNNQGAGIRVNWDEEIQFNNDNDLFIDGGNDRVGIGTSSPQFTLDVAGDINASNVNVTTDICITGGNCLSAAGTGSGDVVGPGSATDNAIARFDTTTGKLIQNSAVTIDDGGNLANVGNISVSGNFYIGSGTVSSSGSNSIALGANALSTNSSTVAIGYQANASATYAVALGYDTLASAIDTVSVGSYAEATNSDAVALGSQAAASGAGATSLGNAADASGTRATAVGQNSIASGSDAIAIGNGANSSTERTIAIGPSSIASSTDGIAIGYQANASGASGIAIGEDTVSAGNTVAIGYAADAGTSSLGVAVGPYAKVETTHGLAIGSYANVSGQRGMAIGPSALPSEQTRASSGAIALGINTTGGGDNSVAIGRSSTTGSASNGVALGMLATVSGAVGIAIGSSSAATAANAIAIGEDAVADQTNSISLGEGADTDAANQLMIGSSSFPLNTTQHGSINVTASNDICITGGNCLSTVGSGTIGGSGSAGTLPYFTDSTTLADSIVSQSGGTLTVNGNISMPEEFWIGNGATATGDDSLAIGKNTESSNTGTIAIGDTTVANDTNAVAIGSSADAREASAIALGNNAQATDTRSISIGDGANAIAENTISIGSFADAEADRTIAIGNEANASNTEAIALGYNALASGIYATALGEDADATATDATAVGSDAQATGANTVAMGNAAEANDSGAVAVGNNADAVGNSATAVGLNTVASATGATALGTGADATGAPSIALGSNSQATATNAIALGVSANANSSSATAIGASTLATQNGALAIGLQAEATGITGSIAIGRGVDATGAYATALGLYAQSSGTSSIAIGGGVTAATGANASANDAIAIGPGSDATAVNAIAFGDNAQATDTESIALGFNAATTAANQLMIGASTDNLDTYIHGDVNASNFSASVDFCISGGNCLSDATVGAVDGSGTANTVPKFSDSNTLTDSIITDDGNVTIDTSTLVVDAANNRVGIGDTTPDYFFSIAGDATEDIAEIQGVRGGWILASGNTNPARIYSRNDGTFPGLNLESNENVRIFADNGSGTDGLVAEFSYTNTDRGTIESIRTLQAPTNWDLRLRGADTANDAGDGVLIQTDNGSGIFVDRFTVEADSASVDAYFTNVDGVGIGTSSPGELLEVAGNINSTGGDICITGGNCLSAAGTGSGNITGSGSSGTLAYYDGTGSITHFENLSFSVANGGRLSVATGSSGTALTVGGDRILRFTEGGQGIVDSGINENLYLRAGGNGENMTMYLTGSKFRINGFDPSGVGATIGMQSDAADEDTLVIAGYDGQTADLLVFVNDSNSILSVFDNDGQLGIGTSAPSSELHVVGDTFFQARFESTVNNGGIQLENVDNNIYEVGFDSGERFILFDRTNSEYDMVIEDNGYVGIGTSSPSYPFEVFEANANGNATYFINNNGGHALFSIETNVADRNAYAQFFDSDGASAGWQVGRHQSGDKFTIQRSGERNLGSGQLGRDFVIDYSGNVGIGYDSPGEKLEVNGSINVSSTGDVCITGGNCLSTVASSAIDGSGTANQITYWSDSDTVTGRADFLFNPTNGRTSLNTSSANSVLNIGGDRIVNFVGGNAGIRAPDGSLLSLEVGETSNNYSGIIAMYSSNIRLNGYDGAATLNVKSYNDINRIGAVIAASDGQTNDLLRFNNDSNSVMSVFDSQAYLGIRNSNPQTELHVDGTILVQDTAGDTVTILRNAGEANDSRISWQNATGTTKWGLGQFSDNGDIRLYNYDLGSTQVSFHTGGTVGINTESSSNYMLDIHGQGTDFILMRNSSGSQKIALDMVSQNAGKMRIYDATGTAIMLSGYTGEDSYFNAGQVAIGKTTANFQLDVDGQINASGVNVTTDVCLSDGTCLSNTGTGSGNISGSGTAGTLPYFSDSDTLADSIVSQASNVLTIDGNISMPGNFYIGSGTISSSGSNSIALGVNALSTNSSTVAIGSSANASGSNSLAIGVSSVAALGDTVALGRDANALGTSDTAIGSNALASGQDGLAAGDRAVTTGRYGVSLGKSANVSGQEGIGIGYLSIANSSRAIALGSSTTASAGGAIALGYGSVAGGTFDSIAIGTNAGSYGANALAIGEYTVADGTSSIAIGPASATAQGANVSANYGIAIGYDTLASAIDAVSIGSYAEATNTDTVALGSTAAASGAGATALGNEADAPGTRSTAVGQGAYASNSDSIAIGYDANSSNERAISIGPSAIASDTDGIAIGYQANASGASGIAIGEDTVSAGNTVAIGYAADAGTNSLGVAVGPYAKVETNHGLAIGSYTNASGVRGMAIGPSPAGEQTRAGANAIALGRNTTAGGDGSIAIGLFADSGSASSSIAIGVTTEASGAQSIGIGDNASVTATNAIGIGENTVADQTNSIALGEGADTTAVNQLMIGSSSFPLNTTQHGSVNVTAGNDICITGGNCLSTVGSGTIDGSGTAGTLPYFSDSDTLADSIVSQSSNTLTIDGNVSVPANFWIGNGAVANQTNTVAIGVNTIARGGYGVAIGYQADADIDSVAIGRGADTEGSAGGTAVGRNALANNTQAVAIGMSTTAIGSDSIAIGDGAHSSGGNGAIAMANSNASGAYSIAMAVGAKASNSQAVAIGRTTLSGGIDSVAIGFNATATANYDTAVGRYASAQGGNSVALGGTSLASGADAIAIGDAEATGTDSIAMGDSASVSNTNSIAIGNTAIATQANSVAMGVLANASGSSAIALSGTAAGTGSIAIGYDAESTAIGGIVLGYQSEGAGSATVVGYQAHGTSTGSVAIGNAANDSTGGVSIGPSSKTEGLYSTSIGRQAISSAQYAFAGAYQANASGSQSVALGYNSETSGTNTVSIGTSAEATGTNAVAIGVTSEASGVDSTVAVGAVAIANVSGATAVGASAEAIAVSATAYGVNTEASGGSAVAIGNAAEATQANSVAIGVLSEATGQMAIAVGLWGNATATDSIAIGQNTDATATNAIAFGEGAQAAHAEAIALGFNAHTTAANQLMIGNDTDTLDTFQYGSITVNTAEDICINGGNCLSSVGGAWTTSGNTILPNTVTNNISSNGSANAPLFVDNTNGRVGIGTASPTHELEVEGDIFIDGDANHIFFDSANSFVGEFSNSDNLEFRGGGGSTADTVYLDELGRFGIGDADPDFDIEIVNSTTSGSFAISSTAGADGDILIVDGSDNVGIGTTGPDAKLHVNATSGDLIEATNASGTVFKVDSTGEVFSDVAFSTPATDLAEAFWINGGAEPGDLVVIDVQNDEVLTKSTEAYDTLIAGVVSTKPGLKLGDIGQYVALAGRVPINVVGEVNRGDLLTSSNEPGKAMACEDPTLCIGAIVGKALTNNENGQVIGLVTLQ